MNRVTTALSWLARGPALLAVSLIRLYQRFISPLRPPSCKYYPSCSAYAVLAVERHGLLRGGALAAWRLLRCNPWSLGGVDDVPDKGRWRNDGHRCPEGQTV